MLNYLTLRNELKGKIWIKILKPFSKKYIWNDVWHQLILAVQEHTWHPAVCAHGMYHGQRPSHAQVLINDTTFGSHFPPIGNSHASNHGYFYPLLQVTWERYQLFQKYINMPRLFSLDEILFEWFKNDTFRERQHPPPAAIRKCDYWPSVAISNNDLLHGTLHHATKFQAIMWFLHIS